MSTSQHDLGSLRWSSVSDELEKKRQGQLEIRTSGEFGFVVFFFDARFCFIGIKSSRATVSPSLGYTCPLETGPRR